MVGGSDVLLLGRHRARRRAIWNVLRESDSVVAVSEDLAECVCRGGISAEKVHVVRRGVNRELFQPGDRSAARQRLGIATDRPTLIAVGRLVPVKGFSVLIEACRQLHEQRIPIACYILGSGPLEKALHEQIRRHRLEDVVYLAGGQTQAALANWYRAADLTVLSSLSEGVPNVLLESIASGTPFVATRVGGLPEIADPRAHRLVPPNHPAALAEAIADRLQQGPYSAPLRFEPLSWSESAEELCQVIANCRRDGDAGPRIHGDTPVSAELLTTPQAQR
jgi:glycosyltransferase involved in cell wall biosynthesis